MSTSLTTQNELRTARNLKFCYLCGKPFAEDVKPNRDHVPPKRLFAEADRTPPLILPTHDTCNNVQSSYDEQVGQLVSLLWRESPGPKDVSSLRLSMHAPDGMVPFGAVEALNLRSIIARWLKGFHAALYREFLPRVNGAIHEPFPGGDTPGEDATLHASQGVFVREIKKNRAAGRVDRIHPYNGQCLYECTWSQLDDRRPICVWALDLYGWHRLGDPNYQQRSCVGWYEATNGIPDGASCATTIEVLFRNTDPLNAFE